MSAQPSQSFAHETTPPGEQSLVPGVAPITLADRLAARAAQPLGPRKPQRACDLGLFDETARKQLELFGGKTAADHQLPPSGSGGG